MSMAADPADREDVGTDLSEQDCEAEVQYGRFTMSGFQFRFGVCSVLIGLALLMAGCSQQGPAAPSQAGGATNVSGMLAAEAPATPPFNLEAALRDVNGGPGFGLVKFRQPKDADLIVYLDAWVRDLSPNTAYLLQRAVDTVVDGSCTSTSWLTLGKGLTPEPILTDDRGFGRAELFRALPDNLEGTAFDIYFRVIESATSAVVLQSGCYEYVASR
jgi:hypothetical protein